MTTKSLSALLLTLSAHCVFCYKITILHNNDFHSRFAPTTVDGSPCDENKYTCIAGVARTVQAVKDIRAAADADATLFLAAGDFFQGSLWYTSFKHEVVSAFVPYMGYDVISLGNHEFDDGVDGLTPFLDKASLNKLPIVCANINTTIEPRLKQVIPSIVKTYNNRRIGIIGYLTPETSYLSSPGETVVFEEEIVAIKREVEKLKNRGINIIIAVGHSGYWNDIEIAKAIPDLDIVVGGHTNTFLWNKEDGPQPSTEQPQGRYPTVVPHGDSKKTLVITAYAFGKYLGKLDVEFDNQGLITSYSGKPILLNSSYPKDSAMNTIVDKYQKEIDRLYSEVIGKSAVYLEGVESACRKRECSMGNVASDALVYGFLQKNDYFPSWTHYPIAIDCGGDIRTSFNATEKKGNITLGDIVAILPFSNSIVVVKTSGKVLWEMFEHSVSQYDWHAGRFLQVSGIQVTYDISKSVGSRVVSINVRCGDCEVPHFEPIDLEKQYTFLTTDYMARGGDDYHMLTRPDVIKENFDEMKLDLVIRYIKSRGIITTGLEGRIKFVASASSQVQLSHVIILLSFIVSLSAIIKK